MSTPTSPRTDQLTGQRTDTALPPRPDDIFRHLEDLRTRSYEGVHDWAGKLDLFNRAMTLLDPLVRQVLDETDRTFLDGTGTTSYHDGEDSDGGAWARWELSWPAQQQAEARDGGRVQPIQVVAKFAYGGPHPHLSGSVAGMWSCQVTDAADAARQEPIIRAIIETELHQRIFDGRWGVIPAFVRRHETEPTA